MSRKQITDPDLEVIGMANASAARRRRVAANRATLKQIASENKQLRKAAWWRDFRSMMFEAGASAVTGVIFVLAMGNGLVDPIVGVPMLLACMVWTAIRVDRFVRR